MEYNITDDDFQKKIKSSFLGNTVKKDLVHKAGLEFLPRYVSEFVLSNFDRNGLSQYEIIKKAKNFINRHLPERNSTEYLKHKLLEEGEIKLLNEFHILVDIKKNEYTAYASAFTETMKTVGTFVNLYPALSMKGMWGLGTIRHIPTDRYAAELIEFDPVQLGSFDIDELISARMNFTTKEWIDLIILSTGINPKEMTTKTKLYLIARLLPLSVKNINIIELGPKSTGKTYTFRHLTSYAHIASGSVITPAKLIYDLSKNQPGVIMTADTVVFDEIVAAEFGDKKDTELIGMLKDFMEGGNVSRGKVKIQEDTSLIYLGNIDIKGNKPKFDDFLKDMPKAFSDTAFIDRVHAIIPGWAIPKITEAVSHFATGYGLTGNYLSEFLHRLRSYTHPELNWESYEKDLYFIRNEKGVKKIVEGLMGIIYPGVKPSENEMQLLLDFSCELRQTVCDQLHLLDEGEFRKIKLSVRYRD